MRISACPVLVLIAVPLTCFGQQQDLDRKAWDHTWDRFEEVVTGSHHGALGDKEWVNILKFPRPIDGGVPGKFNPAAKVQLQNIAGIVPKREFSLDPSDQDIRLHNVYRTVLMSVQVPAVSADQQKKIDDAATNYDELYKVYDKERSEWSNRIIKEIEDYKKLGGEPDESTYFQIRDATSGAIAAKKAAMDSALGKWYALLPPDWALTAALSDLHNATNGSADVKTNGTWRYDVSDPLNWGDDTCAANGWYELKVASNVASQKTRTTSWNGSGGWSGSFFKIGGNVGASNFTNVVSKDSDSVGLRFCQIRYVGVTAPWLHMDVLKGIDSGIYQLKPSSPLVGKKILGPDGLIPRIVKGLVVARDIQMNASLEATRIDEMKRSYGGGGGFGVGPIRFGGSASKTEYKIDQSNSSGSFGLSTNYGRPVVLAIVIEETSSATNAGQVAVVSQGD